MSNQLDFASDNEGPAHPKVLEALIAANEGHAPAYGDDSLTAQVQERLRDLFEAPEAAVHLVPSGTAANALILATLCQPFDTIFCARHAHIQEDECNAPEFYTGGAKLTLVDGPDGKIGPAELAAALAAEGTRGVHGPQHGALSLTQATEKGTIYSLDETRALTAQAAALKMPVHLDGSRLANALPVLGGTPAEASWRVGITALSFGGAKNGLIGVEAVVLFDPQMSWEFQLRRKRAGQLISKHRFLAAQMLAALEGDLWQQMAAAANAAAARLAEGLGARGIALQYPPQANILFAELPAATHQRLTTGGARYHTWSEVEGRITARLVCDWSKTEAEVDAFLALLG